MANYRVNLSGEQIEAALNKVVDIEKTATEINTALSYIDNIRTAMTAANVGEVMAKSRSGNFTGTGIINTDTKILFPTDGRFPDSYNRRRNTHAKRIGAKYRENLIQNRIDANITGGIDKTCRLYSRISVLKLVIDISYRLRAKT